MAELSVNKTKRKEGMNNKKTVKQIKQITDKLGDEFYFENVLIIGDSKVQHLSFE